MEGKSESPRRAPLVVGLGEVLWDLFPEGKQLGGAPANFAYHATMLGARAVVASAVGDDSLGQTARRRLEAVNLDTTYLTMDAVHPTGTVQVIVDSAGVAKYEFAPDVAWDFLPLTDSLLDLARKADAICFGTLAQRSVATRGTIHAMVRAADKHCLRVFDVNLRQAFYSRQVIDHSLKMCDVAKLNDAELETVAELLNLPSGEDRTVASLLERYSLQWVIVTRGAAGSALCSREATDARAGIPVNVVDTVGAGDAFTAAFVLGLLRGHEPHRIHDAARRLAAHVCGCAGAMPPIPAGILSGCE